MKVDYNPIGRRGYATLMDQGWEVGCDSDYQLD
jgi:hypothetical protein